MHIKSNQLFFPLVAVMVALTTVAHAETSADVGIEQAVRAGTQLYADVLEPGEAIFWDGIGSVDVTSLDGTTLATLAPGESYTPVAGVGTYGVLISTQQSQTLGWTLEVTGAPANFGRIWSYAWQFNAGSFSQSAGTSSSFYALLPTGSSGESAVIELKLEGLAGYIFDISANRFGVNGVDAGRSVSQGGNSLSPEFAIYLRPPQRSTYSVTSAGISDFAFDGARFLRSESNADLDCDAFVSGSTTGAFTFQSLSNGTYHLQCDLNRDGVFSRTGTDDLLLVGPAVQGENTVAWDGTDRSGATIALGEYDCRVEVHGGEFHYVGRDIETSFPGIRMYEVHADQSRLPLTMYWDDGLVQANAVNMVNGEIGLESSGEQGINSGAYGSAIESNINARSWGNFSSGGKGNETYLDTFVWLTSVESTSISLQAQSGTADTDGDGLTDFEENCVTGTDDNNADTDGDGIPDSEEFGTSSSTSAGSGGLESQGNRAQALAVRRVEMVRSKIDALQMVGFVRNDSDEDFIPTGALSLAGLFPQQGPYGWNKRAATPLDLSAVTNAVAVEGADYHSENGLSGAILLIETVGEYYEHSKAICDRAHGAELLNVETVFVAGHPMQRSTFLRENGEKDYALQVLIRADETTGARVGSAWLREAAATPAPHERVIEAQIWARVPGSEVALAEALLLNLNAQTVVSFEQGTETPVAFTRQATLEGSEVKASFHVPDGDAQAFAYVKSWGHDDTRTIDVTDTLFQYGRVFIENAKEVDIDLVKDGVVVDRVWASDGVYASAMGTPQETGADCVTPDATYAHFDALSGARMKAARNFGGCAVFSPTMNAIFRPLGIQPLNAKSQTHMTVFLGAHADTVQVCLESGATESFGCAQVLPATEARWETLPLSAFETPTGSTMFLTSVDVVTVTREAAQSDEMSISGLSFLTIHETAFEDEPVRPLDDSQCACVSTANPDASAPIAFGLIVLLGFAAAGRRHRARKGVQHRQTR